MLQNSLNFKNYDLFTFARNAFTQREYLKFEFTRNLSDALELIAEVGSILGFSRSELSHLDIKQILNYQKYNKNQLKNQWKKMISKNKAEFEINSNLHFPPLITTETDFDVINYHHTVPNFITSKKVEGEILILNNKSSHQNLKQKIILIENADPGFDWIFTQNPKGLITKYGGVASHMAIRCAEIGLPAAIGVGDLLFEKLLLSTKILLDSENHQIIFLKHKNVDEFLEEKKALKSLGYIK